MTVVLNRQLTPTARYPFIFKYELEGDQDGSYEDQMDDPVGSHSFACREMCLDVLDIAYTSFGWLRDPDENGCGVDHIRTVDPLGEGLRECMPVDANFPLLTLRPEVSLPGQAYAEDRMGLNSELYNPPYFVCGSLPYWPEECFEPIYGHGCLNINSVIYLAPVAAWSSRYADIVPETSGGVAARSAVWGFAPFYFEPAAVRQALEVILFDEWRLPRK
jgi:hypothetical protein